MNRDVSVKIFDEACLPVRIAEGDAGIDLCAREDFTVMPGYPKKVPLGAAFKIPEGMFGMLTHRSSLAFKHSCTCSLGVIDSSFTGEVHALIFNHGLAPRHFKKGDRICQLIFMNHYPVNMYMRKFEDAGKEGFGSSGGYHG